MTQSGCIDHLQQEKLRTFRWDVVIVDNVQLQVGGTKQRSPLSGTGESRQHRLMTYGLASN